MDAKMPGMGGATATSCILDEMPGIKILAISIYTVEEYMTDMMQAGVVGYILKGCDAEELMGAIRQAVSVSTGNRQ
jgi:DNA-binding NarL/FixJ family response regulator